MLISFAGRSHCLPRPTQIAGRQSAPNTIPPHLNPILVLLPTCSKRHISDFGLITLAASVCLGAVAGYEELLVTEKFVKANLRHVSLTEKINESMKKADDELKKIIFLNKKLKNDFRAKDFKIAQLDREIFFQLPKSIPLHHSPLKPRIPSRKFTFWDASIFVGSYWAFGKWSKYNYERRIELSELENKIINLEKKYNHLTQLVKDRAIESKNLEEVIFAGNLIRDQEISKLEKYRHLAMTEAEAK